MLIYASFAESRREGPDGDPLLQLFVFRMETQRALEQQLLLFAMTRVGNAALDWAYGLARLVVVKPDALGASGRGIMPNVYIEARPKGRSEGTLIEDYVVEDHADHVMG